MRSLKRTVQLIGRLEQLLDRLEQLLPVPPAAPDWETSIALRWRGDGQRYSLHAIPRPQRLALADLLCIDHQKAELDRNTRQFLAGFPANNALLWGARGTGKSSLIKALLHEYADRGLRLIEVNRHDLLELPRLLDLLQPRPERFVIYVDDLSFEADDAGYKALKATLEGSLSAAPDNVLIYATSNRRHLLPEPAEDNQQARWVGDELHPGEAIEEKISLSERFGIWLAFHPFDQSQYLHVVGHWLAYFGASGEWETARAEALRYALLRGSRSGRVAYQFAKDWSGRTRLATAAPTDGR